MTVLISLCLIFFSSKELLNEYYYQKKKKVLDTLFNEDQIKPKNIKKSNQVDAFQKIVAKNSGVITFLNDFQNQQLWKVYAIVIFISVFFLINGIFNFLELNQSTLAIALLLIAVVVIIIPEKIVNMQTKRRIKGISKDLPLIIDIMAIMVKSGMTVENGLNYLSTRVDNINKDISAILERACMMMEVNGIDLAVDLIYREVPSKEMRMFCTTLKRNINYGNSIYDALLDLSTEMREMQRLDIEEKIASISAKMTVPMMIFILFPVLIVIAGPIILKILDMSTNS